MFAQPVDYLTLDGKWSDVFTIADPTTGTVLDLTAMTAKIVFTPDRNHCCNGDDYQNSWSSGKVTASTATGEILNGGTAGTLTVTVALSPGVYKIRGETSVAGHLATPFLNGQLTISRDGWAQIAINPISTALVWNDGGVVALTNDLTSLPTTLPSLPGVLWNNGGVLSIS